MQQILRNIPKVDNFLGDKDIAAYKKDIYNEKMLTIIRDNIDKMRDDLKNGLRNDVNKDTLFDAIKENILIDLSLAKKETLRKVINATGVIIHTNLGRARVSSDTANKVHEIATNYNNLEYSVTLCKRRSRMFYIEEILKDLIGCEAALVVNNNAAAIYLVLNALCKECEVIVSRGELVEIGDSFRISEIMAESGCILKEVGTTNKTHLWDYERNITENTKALLKVHTSNFKILGFTGDVATKDLAAVACDNSLILIEDMGSGVLFDMTKLGLKHERSVMDALKEGADIITFSGDKLLGGPQAGIIVGKKKYIDILKKNQMLRCLRIDKMCLVALSTTLSHYFSEEDLYKIPAIKMAALSTTELNERAVKLKGMVVNPKFNLEILPHKAMFGGGSLPEETIDSVGIYVTSQHISTKELNKLLHLQEQAIVTTSADDKTIFDLRTMDIEDFSYVANVLNSL